MINNQALAINYSLKKLNIMKRLLHYLLAVAVSASVIFASCETSTGSLDANTAARIASLEQQAAALQQALNALEDASSTMESELKAQLGARQDELDAKYEDLQEQINSLTGVDNFHDFLERLKALEERQGDVDDCMAMLAQFATTISELSDHIASLNSALEGKIDQETYNAFVTATNEKIMQNSDMLLQLYAYCQEFLISGDGESIKQYIDRVVRDVRTQLTSAMGSYVLQSTYDAFYAGYLEFQSSVNSQLAQNSADIQAIYNLIKDLNPDGDLDEILGLEQTVADVQSRLELLEGNAITRENIKEQFSKDNQAFADGVNSIVAEALAANGSITDAIVKSADTLKADYNAKIDALTERIDQLESRVADIESKLESIMNRIQSLVYVPKTSDGKIHIGTTYIAQTDEEGNEIGQRIELTPTKKLEYRVSPADLRDKVLELYRNSPESFMFYQEHVTRAESRSMDEFHIVKIEEGNGAGEILVTVDNEHDFTHEDLAVALCIKGSANGVTSEFTSPYTTVVGDGRNICNRFYMAKVYNGEWVVSRDDNITYLLPYNERTPVTFNGGDYQLVYDNGESVMTIDEAKARFEWEANLEVTSVGINDAFSMSGMTSGSYTLSPSSPNVQRDKPVVFTLNQAQNNNIRGTIVDKYCVSVSDGQSTVAIIPEVNVSLVVIGDSYSVDPTDIYWNFSKWNSGHASGNTVYESSYGLIWSHSIQNNVSDLSHYPEREFNEIFAKGAEWTIKYESGEVLGSNMTVQSTDVLYDGNSRKLQFTLNGYLYNDSIKTLTLSRSVNTAHIVGTKGLTLSATVRLHAPHARSFAINKTVSASEQDSHLFYFCISERLTGTSDKPTYTKDELDKYFDGSYDKVDTMLGYGKLSAKTAWQDSNSTYSLPVEYVRGRDEAISSSIVTGMLVAHPKLISTELNELTVFNAPENYMFVVPDGPKFPITGTVTVTPSVE